MTICVGMLARNGVVIAADTQENIGNFKVEQSKILIANRNSKGGAMAASGAGWGVHLDAINQELCDSFVSKRGDWDRHSFELALRRRIRAFHGEHIVPYGEFPDSDRPNCSLLVASEFSDGNRGLWSTSHSAIRTCRYYGAVGLGAAYAKLLLGRLWADMDVFQAAALVAYVMLHVGQSIDGCGNEAQIAILKNGHSRYMEQAKVSLYQDYFRSYAAHENLAVQFIIGANRNGREFDLDNLTKQLAHYHESITTLNRSGLAAMQEGKRELDRVEITQRPRGRRN